MTKLDFTHATDVRKTCPVCILRSGSKQWGRYNTSGGVVTVPLNLSMQNTNYSVVMTYVVDASGSNYELDAKVQNSGKTVSNFKAYLNTNAYWLVIG